MKDNSSMAKAIAATIRGFINQYNLSKDVELYVPAEHEDFVHRTYDKKYLSVDQILEIDCDIIDECAATIIFNPEGYVIQGCLTELQHTAKSKKPICVFSYDSVDLAFQFIRLVHEKSVVPGGSCV
ncbi:MAG: hypothetical protein IMZ53_04895 [Thermoplasmata archaeon]|nr:hypothetical protein [Thermoplasmata archaeon]